MSIRFEPLVFAGPYQLAVLAEYSLHTRVYGAAVFAQAVKKPAAILIRRAGTTIAFKPDGASLDPDELERTYPGQREAFARLTSAHDHNPE